jgi:membrane associated rhomboid family serine protease
MPALVLIGLWVALQLFSEVGTMAGLTDDGVALMAHFGGLLFGAITACFFDAGRPQPQEVYE